MNTRQPSKPRKRSNDSNDSFYARHGVAPHALASQSALAVLRDGGNAIEAMVAAAATISIAYRT